MLLSVLPALQIALLDTFHQLEKSKHYLLPSPLDVLLAPAEAIQLVDKQLVLCWVLVSNQLECSVQLDHTLPQDQQQILACACRTISLIHRVYALDVQLEATRSQMPLRVRVAPVAATPILLQSPVRLQVYSSHVENFITMEFLQLHLKVVLTAC